MNVSKIIKINILSIVAFPVLIIAILAKLISKALEKIVVFIGVFVAFIALNTVYKYLSDKTIPIEQLVVGALAFFAGITIFGFLISLAMNILGGLYSIIISIFEGIFTFCHNKYSNIYDLCKKEYENIMISKGNSENFEKSELLTDIYCIFWSLLRVFNVIFVKLISFSLTISVLLSIGFVTYGTIYINNIVNRNFGVNIVEYVGMFPMFSRVLAVLYYLMVMVSVVLVLISLGLEWREWGVVLKFATQNYSDYREKIFNRADEIGQVDTSKYNNVVDETAVNTEGEKYLEKLRNMIDNIEHLKAQVDAAMSVRYDTSMSYDFSRYLEDLEEIVQYLDDRQYKISYDKFKSFLIPRVDRLEKLKIQLEQKVKYILDNENKTSNTTNGLDFFAGCKIPEEIKQRYKSLCKIYHPDVGGDEEMFKILQEQYDKIKPEQIHTQQP